MSRLFQRLVVVGDRPARQGPGDLGDVGREFTKPGQDEDEGKMPAMQLRDLMSAMWLERLKDPSQARLIHRRAKTAPRQGQGPSPTRSGLGAQPWTGTWA